MNNNTKVSQKTGILTSNERLALIQQLELVDTLPEETFDRLTRLASRLLPTPVSLVSIVEDKRQFFKSFVGLGEPWASSRETSLSHSFCQHVVKSGKPLIIEDAREHPLVKDNLAIPDLGVISYLGMPITMKNGHTLGSFCVIDHEARQWTQEDIDTVHELAKSVITEIELRYEVRALRESEIQREAIMKELQETNEDLADFAYIVSHDLKAPLRGIRSLAEWILSDYTDVLDEDGQDMLGLLERRVERMQYLIEGILQYSRVGRIEDKWENIDLNELLTETVEALNPPPHIKVIISDNLPTIYGGHTRLSQLFQNLLSNAIKFMDKPEGHIEIACLDHEDNWEFQITDNGPGIEERHFKKVFQMFQTLNARDEFESTGIGLTIVKKVVELHGGKVTISSVVGEGTTFAFTVAKAKGV